MYARHLVFIGGAMTTVFLAHPASAQASAPRQIAESTSLEADHHGPIVITGSHITLDCAGHRIAADGVVDDAGIRIVGHENVTIKDCHIDGGFEYGLLIRDSAGARILSSTVTGAQLDGAWLSHSPHSEVVASSWFDNGNAGLRVWDSEASKIVGNLSTDNGGPGLWLLDSALIELVGNTSEHNGEQGFELANSDRVYAVGNTVRENLSDGIVVTGSLNGRLVGNFVHSNQGRGIAVSSESHDSELQGNVVMASAGHGIEIAGSNGVIATSNQTSYNFSFGLKMTNAELGRIEFNQSCNNHDFDVVLDAGSINNEFNGNWFCTSIGL